MQDLFYKQHFCKQQQAEICKKRAKVKQHPKGELLLFKIISIIHQSYHAKIVGSILKMYRKQVQLFK